jgi:serine/threonine protein phosphatase PrpC
MAGDDVAFCKVDGTPLGRLATAVTMPFRGRDEPFCGSCGARNPGDDDLYCAVCGRRLDGARSTFPGPVSSKIGDFTVVRAHGDGDVIVTDIAGRPGILLFGPKAAIADEARALAASDPVFPSVLAEGDVETLGHYVVVGAERLESRGFTWEPSAGDLYLRPGGGLMAVRARGARRRLEGEPLNAKRVTEALREALLPAPMVMGTPGLVRLLLPHTNFSTVATQSIEASRRDVAEGEAAAAVHDPRALAELCDPGLRRNHNEDAVALASGDALGEPFSVLVVCDGVSSSTFADQASKLASQVARDELARFASSGNIANMPIEGAVRDAIRAAHVAVCTSDIDYGDGAPPGTTIVAALVYRKTLTVGWLGDSRAYWVSDDAAELCTTDHSWMNEAVERGDVSAAEALRSPLAHALTKCLGPLETGSWPILEVEPDVRTKALVGPGHLIVCTDGLWNYFPSPVAIAGLVRGAGKDADAHVIARRLVCHALVEGGGDNVSVAVQALT